MISKIPLWAKIIGGGATILLAAAAFFFAVTGALNAANGLVEKGEELSDARWQAVLAKKELEAQDAIEAARIAGKAEGEAEKAEAETRARNALNALREARNADPEFDKVLRGDWPDDYFVSVCGARPGCRPPD